MCTYLACIRQNIAMTFGIEKLKWFGILYYTIHTGAGQIYSLPQKWLAAFA